MPRPSIRASSVLCPDFSTNVPLTSTGMSKPPLYSQKVANWIQRCPRIQGIKGGLHHQDVPSTPINELPHSLLQRHIDQLAKRRVAGRVGSALGPILPVWFVDPSGGVLRRDLVAGLARQPHTNKVQFVACASIVVAPPWQRSSTRVQLSWNHLPVFRGPC
jgi:hypothetical protein